MVVFALLLLNCIEIGWAEVLDDDGNVITEAVIEVEMSTLEGTMEQGCIRGCFVGWGALLILVGIAGESFEFECSDSRPSFFDRFSDGYSPPDYTKSDECERTPLSLKERALFMLGGIAIAMIGVYETGKQYDRQQAIERIKAQRRQKNNAFSEPEITDGFRLQLLTVRF